MAGGLRTLILLNEAPSKEPIKPDEQEKTEADKADKKAKSTAKDDSPGDDLNLDDSEDTDSKDSDASKDDAPDEEETDDDKSDDSSENDSVNDTDTEGAVDTAAPDAAGDRLRREQLLDAISVSSDQATALGRSLGFLADRVKDPQAKVLTGSAKRIVDEAARQCSVLLINFTDLGEERARTIFTTVRERVTAVAEIVKHVIDGDDDFRDSDSDSGKTERRNDPPSGKA